MAVTVGIDIGTTSVKAVAADDEGRIVRRARVPHEVHVPSPDHFEHDAGIAWRDGVLTALDEVDGPDVAGIAVAAMVPSLAAVDAEGRPVGPGLLYGDVRGASALSGSPTENAEFLGFLRWSAASHPDAAAYWPAQAVANHALCGRGAIDTTTAMTTLPLFDGTGWDPAVCDASGVDPAQLPLIAVGTAAIGERWGVPVNGGTIDALAEQLVAGADHDGDVLVVVGTTLICWAVTEGWPEIPGLWTVPHTAPGRTLVGGASNAGGLFCDRVRRLTGDPLLDLTTLRPDQVPVWVPYIRGERTPWHDPDRRASLHGIDLTHGADAVLRAAHEASGFVVRHHLDLAGIEAGRLVVVGGGTHVTPWMQALADTTGVPVHVTHVPEGAALGAAFTARVTAGLESEVGDGRRWANTRDVLDPDPAWQRACDERYRRYLQLIES